VKPDRVPKHKAADRQKAASASGFHAALRRTLRARIRHQRIGQPPMNEKTRKGRSARRNVEMVFRRNVREGRSGVDTRAAGLVLAGRHIFMPSGIFFMSM
jgi:hypothetical protein